MRVFFFGSRIDSLRIVVLQLYLNKQVFQWELKSIAWYYHFHLTYKKVHFIISVTVDKNWPLIGWPNEITGISDYVIFHEETSRQTESLDDLFVKPILRNDCFTFYQTYGICHR